MRKKLTEYKWQKGLHPPVGPSQSPPSERQWKLTDAGQQFMRDNPNGKAGVDTALTNLVSLIVNKENVDVSGGLNGDGKNTRQGIVRVKNSDTIHYDDFEYGLSHSNLSVESSMWDVISKSKCHPIYDKVEQERVFMVDMQNDKAVFTKERCKEIKLGELLSLTGINSREILVITSGTRFIPLDNANLSLLP